MEQGHIFISNNILTTLLAISEDEQSRGLQYQAWPPPVMSFIYAQPKINKFWMSRTPSPLDIVFCYGGKVSQIHKGDPYSTEIIGLDKLSDLIIEFPLGTVRSLDIKIGNSVGLVKPSKEELRKIFAEKYNILIKY